MSAKNGFLLHLAISLIICAVVALLVVGVWYPQPYFALSGVSRIFWLLIVWLGVVAPLLMLYLYRPGKPGVMIDVWTIAILQVASVAYGLYTMHSERISYAVFVKDRFVLLAQRDIAPLPVPASVCGEQGGEPCYAQARLPEDNDLRNEILFASLDGGRDIERRPSTWRNYDLAVADILAAASPIAKYTSRGDFSQAQVVLSQEMSPAQFDALMALPVVTAQLHAYTLLLDATTAQVVGAIMEDPWRK